MLAGQLKRCFFAKRDPPHLKLRGRLNVKPAAFNPVVLTPVWPRALPHLTRRVRRCVTCTVSECEPLETAILPEGLQGGRDAQQGYFAHKKTPPPRTLQSAYAYGFTVDLGRVAISYERGTPVFAKGPCRQRSSDLLKT